MTNLVKEAIDHAGGVAAVAKALEISRISIYEWIEKGALPAPRIIPVARLGGWKVSPHALDSVIYPNPGDGLPDTPEQLAPSEVAA